MNRLVSMVPLCAAIAVAGCKDPGNAAADPAAGLIRPASDIVVTSVRTYAPASEVAGEHDEYYVVSFHFTNDTGASLEPKIGHFVLSDSENRRYFGSASGDAALVGIVDPAVVLAPGAGHDYTVGFRVPENTAGMLFYDSTF